MYREKGGRQPFLSIRQRDSYTSFDVPGIVEFIYTNGRGTVPHSLSIVSVSLQYGNGLNPIHLFFTLDKVFIRRPRETSQDIY
jgi:hypothetical protein